MMKMEINTLNTHTDINEKSLSAMVQGRVTLSTFWHRASCFVFVLRMSFDTSKNVQKPHWAFQLRLYFPIPVCTFPDVTCIDHVVTSTGRFAGVRVVQRPAGGARRDVLVAVRRGHGRRAVHAAPGHLGLVPALSTAQ